MTMARKKINVGDWVMNGAYAFQVADVGHAEVFDFRGDPFPIDCLTVLSASPATIAKSHRLLMRYFAARDAEIASQCAGNYHARKQAMEAMERHCRRSAKGGRG
jgi:hypothetical protein